MDRTTTTITLIK